MTEEERNERGRRRAALLLLPLFLLGAGCCFWSLFANVASGEAESFIPAPLGSDALANYGEDEIPGRLRSLSISIVEAVIRDRDPEEEDVGSRVDDVSNSLKSPVPTVTPKPGDPTGTPAASPTPTVTPDLSVTGTATLTVTASPSPTRTSTATDVPTVGPTSTSGPTPTPSNTPTATMTPTPTNTSTPTLTPGPCKVPPYIEIIAPLEDERFTLADQLQVQAFAFDPDNANPSDCAITPPGSDGEGIVGDPEVEIKIEWYDGSSWILVHTELESSDPYCAFTSCSLHDLSSGFWPDSPPINTGKHRIKAKVLQDDEGVASGWVSVEFYIDPLPTATPVPPTPTPFITPDPSCSSITLSGFSISTNDANWTLTNGTGTEIKIVQVELDVTPSMTLKKIKLGGPAMWIGVQNTPLTINSGWSGTESTREIAATSSKPFNLEFSSPPPSSPYTLSLTFDTGCVTSFSN